MRCMAKNAALNTSMTNNTPTHDEISAHAYQIYLREGCIEGRDMDHWLQAEAELRQRATETTNPVESQATAERNVRDNSPEQAPRSQRNHKPESILPNSVVPSAAPIAQVSRANTPKRNSGKREAAATR
jgi:hypothetical protein